VDRLKQLFAPLPPASAVASAGTACVRLAARIIASELEATGFSINLAPVLDVAQMDSVGFERMFSTESSETARLSAAFVEELSKKHILACARHFPGMGGATSDPHFVLPRIDRSRRQMLHEDVPPFAGLCNQVGMVMMSHAWYPGLGDENPVPASLSPRIVQGLLRKKIGFRGVTITDDLTMGAISSIGLTPELFLRAFEAGNDMLLFSQTTPLVERAFRNIVKAARTSPVLRQRIDQSVERIILLKSRAEFAPLRYRTHLRARIVRQIERLRVAATTKVAAAHG
jgi:beta-N-acetylhexosaminidase